MGIAPAARKHSGMHQRSTAAKNSNCVVSGSLESEAIRGEIEQTAIGGLRSDLRSQIEVTRDTCEREAPSLSPAAREVATPTGSGPVDVPYILPSLSLEELQSRLSEATAQEELPRFVNPPRKRVDPSISFEDAVAKLKEEIGAHGKLKRYAEKRSTQADRSFANLRPKIHMTVEEEQQLVARIEEEILQRTPRETSKMQLLAKLYAYASQLQVDVQSLLSRLTQRKKGGSHQVMLDELLCELLCIIEVREETKRRLLALLGIDQALLDQAYRLATMRGFRPVGEGTGSNQDIK